MSIVPSSFINMLVLTHGVMVTRVTVAIQFVPFGVTLMLQHLMETKMTFMEMHFIFYRRQVKMQSIILESFFILRKKVFLSGPVQILQKSVPFPSLI